MPDKEHEQLAKFLLAELKKDLPQVIAGVQFQGPGIPQADCRCDGYCGCNENCGCQGKDGCGCNARCPCDSKTAGLWNSVVDPPDDVILSILARFRTIPESERAKLLDLVPLLEKLSGPTGQQ